MIPSPGSAIELRALRILGEQLALAEGRATANVMNVNVDAAPPTSTTWANALRDDEVRDLISWLDNVIEASDDELNDPHSAVRVEVAALGMLSRNESADGG